MSLELIHVLNRNHPSTPRVFAIDHQDRVGEKANIRNDGVVARLGNACQQPHHKRGVGLVDVGGDQFHRLAMSVAVAPDENIVQARSPQRHLICSRLDSPGRAERRRQHQQSSHRVSTPSRHLGTFEGERKRNADQRRRQESTAQMLLGFAVTFAFITCAALILGVM